MKKAQGALEFLMTYGWAFLVILIMIGALAYFGVLDPSRFVPDKCVTAAGINCMRYVANNVAGPTPTVAIEIKNNMGAPIYVYDAEIASVDPSGLNGLTFANLAAGAAAAGQVQIGFDNDASGDLTNADDADGDMGLAENAITAADFNDNDMQDGETKTIMLKMGGADTLLIEKRKMTIKLNFKYYPQDSTATYAKDIPMDLTLSVQ